jgi:uncharacterized protein
MLQYITEYFESLIALTNDMAPYLLLGFLIAGAMYAYLPQEKIKLYLGQANAKSVMNASLLGVPLPLCSCGVIPTGVSFYKNGASKGSSVSFLISTPQTGVDSILVTYSMLGLPFAVIRPVIALITGFFGGIFTNKVEKEDKNNVVNLNEVGTFTEGSKNNRFSRMLHYGFVEFLEDIAKWLVIGLLIAALIAVAVPDNFFAGYIRSDFLGMLIILIASIPLYVCATSSVPIAAMLILKGLSPGAALVFLMAGPATNAATMTVIGNVMGRKTLYSYLFSIIAGALVFGLMIDYLIPRDFFTRFIVHGDHAHQILPQWLQIASSIVFTLLLLNIFIRNVFSNKKKQESKTELNLDMTSKYMVKGMTCNHCKNNVSNALNKIEGIKVLDVDLSKEEVVLEGENQDSEIIKHAVEDIGYTFGGKTA